MERSSRGDAHARDELGRVVQVEHGKDHQARHGSVRRRPSARTGPSCARFPLLVDPGDGDPPERRVRGGQEGSEERNRVDRRVDLRDADDVQKQLLRERDAAAHAGVREDREDGKDGPDDGCGSAYNTSVRRGEDVEERTGSFSFARSRVGANARTPGPVLLDVHIDCVSDRSDQSE